VSEVGFGRTINLGQYENARIEYKAKVKPGQDPMQVMQALKKMANEEEKRVRAEYQQQRH